ncbi:membrane protein [Streptomyces phage Zuko]|uniref:Membrane protein n=1 Tax=Streptomyces phage Zuko TaxID=2601695 RepID=A0A5J6D773_9CAUD|nr:membrane protein [Streptomyces phage Zuko]QEQ93690.1 membrane protein [Streptomyces phage Zuko]
MQGAKGKTEREVHVDTFEVIVAIGVTVIAICNLVTTLRR